MIGRKLKHGSSNTLKDVEHAAEHDEFEFAEEVSQFFAGIIECELVDKTEFFDLGDVSWFCLANVTQAIGIDDSTNFQAHPVTSTSHTLDIVLVPTDASTNGEHSNTISFKALSTQHTDGVLNDAEPPCSTPTPTATTPTTPTPTVTPKTLTSMTTSADLDRLANVFSTRKLFTLFADNEMDTGASLNMSSTTTPNTQPQKCRIIWNIMAKVKAEGVNVMYIDDRVDVMPCVLGKLGLHQSLKEKILPQVNKEVKVSMQKFVKEGTGNINEKTGEETVKLVPKYEKLYLPEIISFIDEILVDIIHHRNQLKHFCTIIPMINASFANALYIDIDFSEYLKIAVKWEPQSLHWHHKQVTFHSGIVKVDGDKYYYTHISEDRNHDNIFADEVLLQMIENSPSPTRTVLINNDNCSNQYKCIQHFSKLQDLATNKDITIVHIWSIAGHGKGGWTTLEGLER